MIASGLAIAEMSQVSGSPFFAVARVCVSVSLHYDNVAVWENLI